MAVHLLKLYLFVLTFKTGFSADSSVFVQTGDSVQLDIQTHELPEFDDLSWINVKSDNIVKYISASRRVRPHPSYTDRVDFNDTTFSLTLKNMQKTDSGPYTARISGVSNTNIVTYRVSVIDAVEDPVLTVNSVWSSNGSCIVNFTCSSHNLTINSSYQNNRCSPEEVTSHENYTLILYCSEESIICNYSNPVSSGKDRIEIKQICVNKEGNSGGNGTESSPQNWRYIWIGVCVFVCALLIVIAVIVYRTSCNKGAKEADTVYVQVETQVMQNLNSEENTYDVPNRVPDQTLEETEEKQSITTYCTVGQHQKPADPIETDKTIYSVVNKQPKPATISSDEA